MRSLLGVLALSFAALIGAGAAPVAAEDAALPSENRATLSPAQARPSEASAQALGRQLLAALVADDPSLARAEFFPREAFMQVKAMARPERYWDRLYARYELDVHTLHRTRPELAQAEFVKLELKRRGGWVRAREEGNRLPYWAARHALLHYRVGSQLHKLELRVLISWGARWYLIHLREFH